jgi:cytochrome c oxidase assembly factor CtaG
VNGSGVAPLALGAALVAVGQFGRAFVNLRRRGRRDHAGWDRPVLFVAGIGISILPLVSPLTGPTLSGHMLEHLLVGDVGPALVLVALRGPLLFFLLPAAAVRAVTRRPPLRRAASFLGRPWIAVGAWAVAYAGWHVPAAYDYALAHEAVHLLEHVSFVVAGALVWTQLVDPARRRRLPVGHRLALAGAVFACGQVLSDVLVLAGRPLYATYAAAPGALGDQQLAGIVMMGEQALTHGVFAALLVRSCLGRAPVRATPAAARA